MTMTFWGIPPKERKGVLVAGQKVLHGLRHGALDYSSGCSTTP